MYLILRQCTYPPNNVAIKIGANLLGRYPGWAKIVSAQALASFSPSSESYKSLTNTWLDDL